MRPETPTEQVIKIFDHIDRIKDEEDKLTKRLKSNNYKVYNLDNLLTVLISEYNNAKVIFFDDAHYVEFRKGATPFFVGLGLINGIQKHQICLML